MASGQLLDVFHPYDNEPPAAGPATPGLRNVQPILSFVGTANLSAVFSSVLSSEYDGGGVTVRIWYSMVTDTSGDIDWDASFERRADGEAMGSDSFAAANSTDGTTVPGTANLQDIVDVTFTDGADMDSVTAGDHYRLKITRDGTSDDANGIAEVYKVAVLET